MWWKGVNREEISAANPVQRGKWESKQAVIVKTSVLSNKYNE